MYWEIYLDQFFLEHLLIGYLLLQMTAVFRHLPVSWKRKAAGSLLNAGIMTLLIVLRFEKLLWISIFPVCIVTFYCNKRQDIMTDLMVLLFVTSLFGGVWTAVYSLGIHNEMLSALLTSAVMNRIFPHLEKPLLLTETMTVHLYDKKKKITVYGMIDSGNHLSEPYTGKPVSIIDEDSVRALLGENWEEIRGYFWIPFHSIGTEKGMMRGVKIDQMIIRSASAYHVIQKPILAIYKGYVSAGGEYQIILNPLHSVLRRKTRRRR